MLLSVSWGFWNGGSLCRQSVLAACTYAETHTSRGPFAWQEQGGSRPWQSGSKGKGETMTWRTVWRESSLAELGQLTRPGRRHSRWHEPVRMAKQRDATASRKQKVVAEGGRMRDGNGSLAKQRRLREGFPTACARVQVSIWNISSRASSSCTSTTLPTGNRSTQHAICGH